MSFFPEKIVEKRKVVLDTAALITGAGSLFALAGIVDPDINTVASHPATTELVTFYTVPNVLQEVRDPHARSRLALLLDCNALQLRAPSSEALSFVSGFARATGDYASLSLTDLRVMALCYMLERERPGSDTYLVNAPPTIKHHLLQKRMRLGQLLTFAELDRVEEEEQRNERDRLAASDGWETVPAKRKRSKHPQHKANAAAPSPASPDSPSSLSSARCKVSNSPFPSCPVPAEAHECEDKPPQPTAKNATKIQRFSEARGTVKKGKNEKKYRKQIKKHTPEIQCSLALGIESTCESGPAIGAALSLPLSASASPSTLETTALVPSEDKTLQADVRGRLHQPNVEDVLSRASNLSIAEDDPSAGSWQTGRRYGEKSTERPSNERDTTAAPAKSELIPAENDVIDHDHGRMQIFFDEVDASDKRYDKDDDTGEQWINEDNIEDHLATDGGQEDDSSEDSGRVSCVTTDFAMQNTMLQMGLKILTVDGRRTIKKIKHFALCCEACGVVTRELERKFCEDCGNATLHRVAFKVNKSGVARVFFNPKKQPILRGTRYPIPMPRGGRHNKDLILREDQIDPVRHRRIQKQLEKANVDVLDPATFYNAGAKFNPNNHPMVVGYGRRNPNEVKCSMRSRR